MSENVISLNEWQRIFLSDVELSDDPARELAEALANKGIITLTELKNGLEIQTNSYVGRIKVGDLQINVQPKLEGMPLYQLLRYAYELRNLKIFDASEHALDRLSFFDLLIYELFIETEDLLRRGIQKSYVLHEENLSSPRGRIDMKRLGAQGGLSRETLPCSYFQRDVNDVLNQTLLAGLKLALKMVSDLNLKMNLRRLCVSLGEDIKYIQLTRTNLRRARNAINRLTERYMAVLEIINILYESQGIQFEDEENPIQLRGYFFDMNVFFETLMGRLLTDYQHDYELKDQFQLHDLFKYTPGFNPKRRKSPTPRPDFALMKEGKVVKLLDAKYRDLWERNLPSGMLYQLAIYAVSGIGGKSSTILYPSMNEVPTIQKIDINNPMTNAKMASVYLQPVNLLKVADLLGKDRRDLKEYVRSIIK
ncbi:McrC family protein [Sporosarcina sp. SAFN-010]|uniref:McrC family protein n=1 Tax=Sporosarcina sp. SAFN-010 TaxID=3387273 RepID=UPI003F81728B